MKHSAYTYIVAGVLCLCAILAVFFLLVMPGLTAVPEPPAALADTADTTPAISPEDAEVIHTLTLAVVDARLSLGFNNHSTQRALTQLVEDFNAQNPDLTVTVYDYDSISAIEQALKSGDAPDMFLLSASDSQQHRLWEYCTDLSVLLDSDSEYSPESFVGGLYSGSTRDGILPWLPYDFTAMSFTVQPIPDQEQTLSLSLAAHEAEDRGIMLFPTCWDRQMLTHWLSSYIFAACAAEENTLDQNELATLLELIKEHPSTFEDMPEDHNYFLAPVFLDTVSCVSQLSHYEYDRERGGGDYAYTGLPDVCPGGVLTVNTCFGVFSSCEAPDVAWSFLRGLLSDEMQSASQCLPAVSSALHAGLDTSSRLLIVERSDAAARLFEVLDSIEYVDFGIPGIGSIICSCAEKYFSGECTAQEAAAALQRHMDEMICNIKEK